MADLTNEDLAFLDENFKRFGTAWAGGVGDLERHFEVDIRSIRGRYELNLTTRATPRVRYIHNVDMKSGAMWGGNPELPRAPSLDSSDLSRVDHVLQRCGELWMLEPLNNLCEIYDLSSGVEGLRAGRELSTRHLGHLAVLYLSDSERTSDYFCVSVDLQAQEILEALWVDLPMSPGRRLTAQEQEFMDRGLRQYGDFGVYGNVTQGLRSLVQGSNTRIAVLDGSYGFFVDPLDGQGHWLNFIMDARTGEIGDCAAGHYEPEPPPECDIEPLL